MAKPKNVGNERQQYHEQANEERHKWAQEVDPVAYEEWANKPQNEREAEFDADTAE